MVKYVFAKSTVGKCTVQIKEIRGLYEKELYKKRLY